MGSLWERQKYLWVKGGPSPRASFLCQSGHSWERVGSLQPSILSGRGEIKLYLLRPGVLQFTGSAAHLSLLPPTFWRGQWCGSSRISLCAFRMGLLGEARASRVGARSCNPRLGFPGEEHCRNCWCLNKWGHSLGQGKEA